MTTGLVSFIFFFALFFQLIGILHLLVSSSRLPFLLFLPQLLLLLSTLRV
jgi:hypothetical protein